MRREKIIYSVLSIAVVVLASAAANFYVLNNNQNTLLMQEQARVLASYAWLMDIQTSNLFSSFQTYHDFIKADQNTPNMTENSLYLLELRSFTLLSIEADSARTAIQTASTDLMDFDLNNAGNFSAFVSIYQNVSETIDYAVDQLDQTTGRTLSHHDQLMFQLCHILGADHNATSNITQLTETSQAFFSIFILCSNIANQNQPKPPVIDVQLKWALENATQLNQHRITWHNSIPSPP
jgi:hypothetical protein